MSLPEDANELDTREHLVRWLEFLKRALHFWPILAAALLIGCLACGTFLAMAHPRYRSETVVLYVEKGTTADAAEAAASRTVAVRLKELLMSRQTLERVLTEFNLYPELRRTTGTTDAVEELKKHVEFRAPGGDTFSIAFEGDSPSQAQNVTAELAHLVIESDSTLRKSRARAAVEFLEGERKATESQLHDAEQNLATFMAQHPRFALDATPLNNGAAIRASLGGAATAGQAAPSAMRLPAASLGGVSAGSVSAAPPRPGAAGHETQAEALAKAAVAAARENLAQQLLHYTPAHPDVRAAQAELARATERLAAAQAAAPAAAPPSESNNAEAAAIQVTPLAERRPNPAPAPAVAPVPVAKANEPAKDLVNLETQWLRLTRAVTEAREHQDQVEGQLFKADIQASSEGAGRGVQVDIIDPAFLPQRALPPGPVLIAAIFFVASLLLGALGALIAAAFDDRLLGARDLNGIASVLVEIPRATRPLRGWRPRGAT
jgi:uncharacterized protein involved in exopolysaccharide biosynthesis